MAFQGKAFILNHFEPFVLNHSVHHSVELNFLSWERTKKLKILKFS